MSSIPPLPARQFPTSGFVKLDLSEKIEEEKLPGYIAEDYFPVHVGQVFASRYRVFSKLGFGTSSTVWLCRDLQEHGFRTLKVCVRGQQPIREIAISNHFKSASDHFGKKLVRLVLDSFEVDGPQGKHTCLVYQPLGMNFTEFQNLCPDGILPKELMQRTLQLILISLAFMHDNNVVHTDISSNNILQGIEDSAILCEIEEDEVRRPIARKVLADRHVYYSRPIPISTGLPVLADLGEARVGNHKHKGDIMPGIYRAPEVILNMNWDEKVDIWSIGVMLTGLGVEFGARPPPPAEYLARSEKTAQYWDNQGNWKGSILIPKQSLETRERQFLGEDRELFLKFLRRILRWVPEERPTAEELAYDECYE